MTTRKKNTQNQENDDFEKDIAKSLRLSQSALEIGVDFYAANTRRRRQYEALIQKISDFTKGIEK